MRFRESAIPEAMPQIRAALLRITDARKALERGEQAWNATQLEDAIRSAEYFIKAAREAVTEHTQKGLIPVIPQPTSGRPA